MSVTRHSIEPVITANMTIRELIETQAECRGDHVFLLDPHTGQSVTYSELRSRVRSVAGHLSKFKIDQGQSIAYALSNGCDCAITILGILYGGFLATAINLIAGAKTISYVLDHSGARLIITQGRHSELLDQAQEEATSQTKRLEIVDLFHAGSELDAVVQSAPLLPGNDGLLMYTSGTTGQPKGVVLSHQNLVAGGLNAASAHKLGPDDRALCVLPLYH
ncbi:MAG: acyl--CoA ligase, partial [bacterium]|nr:acyl--CoA ligase [bacterium]